MAAADPALSTQGDVAGTLRLALWIHLVDSLAFGLPLLIAPFVLVETLAGAEPTNYFWVRWAGGVLIAIAVGDWRAIRDPRGQSGLVAVATMAPLLAGVGLAWGWVVDGYDGATWFYAVMLVATFGLAALMVWARSTAKAIVER